MKRNLLYLILSFTGVSSFAQVGVGTNSPEATMDIRGNMAIEKVEVTTSQVSPLVWDKTDRQVKKGTILGNKFFYALDYRIEAYEVDEWYSQKRQWVSDFDTKIPATQYDVIFARILPVDRDYSYKNRVDISHTQDTDNGNVVYNDIRVKPLDWQQAGGKEQYSGRQEFYHNTNPVMRKSIWESGGTWHISLGYVNGRPDNAYRHKITYEWNVRLIAIPNTLTRRKVIPVSKVKNDASTGWNPIGSYDSNPLNN